MHLNPKQGSGKINFITGKNWIPNLKNKMSPTNSPRPAVKRKISVSFMIKSEHKDVPVHFPHLNTTGRSPSFCNNVKNEWSVKGTVRYEFPNEKEVRLVGIRLGYLGRNTVVSTADFLSTVDYILHGGDRELDGVHNTGEKIRNKKR
jgi:hypothetical protein